MVDLKAKESRTGKPEVGLPPEPGGHVLPRIVAAVVCLVASRAVSAQDFLPPDNFVSGWEKSGPSRTFIRQDLFNHIDGGAELYLEFGFEKLRLQAYTNGQAEISLEVYEMTSPAAALGIYLFQAGRESPWPEVKARNSSEDAQVAAMKGRFFVRVNNFEAAAVPDEATDDPFRILPSDGRLSGTERLVRGPIGLQPYYTFGEGDILGLDGKIFGVLADYKAADGSAYTRLLVDYGDEAAAAAAFSRLRANLDPYLKITEQSDRGFVFVDYQSRSGRVELRDSTLDLRFKMKIGPICGILARTEEGFRLSFPRSAPFHVILGLRP
jgi:hypothetical protein